MFGWINDCTECLIISRYGEDTWHQIKEKAKCETIDGGFLRYKYYPDSDTVALVVAASEVIGISVDDVLHEFGDYFIDYVQDNGYSNVLECLGKNLRDWLSNLNTLHDHLQASYPKGFVAPVFWSEDDPNSSEEEGAILVYYYSQRGSLLVPLVVGTLKKLAMTYFEIEINLERLTLQDEALVEVEEGGGVAENGETHKHTSWKVTTVDPEESFKLRTNRKRKKATLGDNGTVTTTGTGATSTKNCDKVFREVGTQAVFLRVEELVQRVFFKEDCELFHALTLEQYVHLVDYWKHNKLDNPDKMAEPQLGINGNLQGTELYCFEIWTLSEDIPKSWPTLEDLPPTLNPVTMDPAHFGGNVPATGDYPPNEQGVLQTFLPKIRVINSLNKDNTSVDLVLNGDHIMASTLEDAIANNPLVLDANLTTFINADNTRIIGTSSGKMEVKWVIWNDATSDAYHTFTRSDLSTTSVQQFYALVAGTSLDPIKVILQLSETVEVDDDEEDI